MRHFLLLGLLALTTTLSAQLNTTLRGNLEYNEAVNDVWGYAAPDGTEYAIVGILNGVSFVSLADPDTPIEVAFVPGVRSRWRDMKTYGEYAYTVADEGDEGIAAFDLRFLPDSVPFTKTQYNIPGYTQPFIRAHNLYIDTLIGRIYTAGGDRRTNGVGVNRGGIIMFDIAADPLNPTYVGKGPEVYSHDIFVLNDTMYTSEIYIGEMGIYDISNLDNVVKMGETRTPFAFTHNVWTPQNGQVAFTTDERSNAPVAAYDISDKSDIKELFQFRPLGSLNSGTIPHNVHVIDDYLSISYYTDGLRIADASKPDNIIEVANYDTWPGANGDFNGAWGAYPFLPSGLTLVSDRQTGLYVVEIDYKRAARLEGTITDFAGGTPLNGVSVSINATQVNSAMTDAQGGYKTGLADGGSYEVTFTAENYIPLTVMVDMANDVCLRLDTSMVFVAPVDFILNIVDDVTGEPIQGATLRIDNQFNSRSSISSADGSIGLNQVDATSSYQLYVAEWGYLTQAEENVDPADLVGRTIRLTPGYMDDFVTHEGWEATSTNVATSGFWERGVPIGTSFDGILSNPGIDATRDIGNEAYVTGNGGGTAGFDDVDGGTVILTSPMFGPLGIDNLKVGYQYWFTNGGGGGGAIDDTLSVSITNGTETVLVKQYVFEDGVTNVWTRDSFLVSDYVIVNDELQLIVTTSDLGDGHVVEAGLDNFRVGSTILPTGTDNHFTDAIVARVFPNPSADEFTLAVSGNTLASPRLRISDATGRVLAVRQFNGTAVRFGRELPTGFYFVELFDGNQRLYVGKVVKR